MLFFKIYIYIYEYNYVTVSVSVLKFKSYYLAPHLRCRNAYSLNTIIRNMPPEEAMGKNDLNSHIFNLGCKVACNNVAYQPM